jgi:FKBP-type peptidyl-prolyl cis-trans isomerase FkpA
VKREKRLPVIFLKTLPFTPILCFYICALIINNMQKFNVVILLTFIALASCKKDNTSTKDCSPVTIAAPASEVDSLRKYISSNSITATEDPRGFFYSISAQGSGDKPSICNSVTVNYAGKFTDGTQFETANGVSFNLSGLILGWQEGIPLIAAGGSITLYLPPTLAYGAAGSGSIPPNSILIFDIDLKAVN